jgi:subtilisin family serine protease
MTRLTSVILAATFTFLPLSAAVPAGGGWEFLSTTTIGAKAFCDAHPEWDGRGVLIAVCDTGVDLNLPGLLATSDGKPKILDARVFSTEGKVSLDAAVFSKDERGEAVHGKDGRWLNGFDALLAKPLSRDKVLVGYFEEEKFKNSDMEDLNGNGNKGDIYGLVVFETGEGAAKHWAAFLDTNADGSLSDESEIRDFAESRQVFSLRGRDPHGKAEAARFALNLWPGEKEAALFLDDGSHGTHVAGIASGYRIDGQEGYDGIAPGAQLLALKIGNSTLTGGATTSGSMVCAWRYAVKKAAELKMPLVIQMSYGTGSENRGGSDAERLLDQLLDENPSVVATLSAGNEGPGLSTVGMPSRMKNGLAVAAVLAKTTARDIYGANLTQDEMFSFSSRGGESGKPDIACPGFAASTVPVFDKGKNVMRGTSMAAPQAAGACALLLSAAAASGYPARRDWVVASLKRSAKPVAGYGPYDFGAGLVDVPGAWDVYRELAKGNPAEPVLFEAEAESPDHRLGKGPSVYWRGFFPAGEPQEIVITPLWPEGASADFKARYYRAFDFECPADWLHMQNGSHYIKADQGAKAKFTFDGAKLAKPGLYQTSVNCWAKGSSRKAGAGPDLTIPVAVAVPHDLGGGNPAEVSVKDLRPAKVHRVYFRCTADMGSMVLGLSIPAAEKGSIAAALFDPEGRDVWNGSLKPENRKVRKALNRGELEPGTWELTLTANYANVAPAEATVRIQGVPMAAPPPNRAGAKLKMGKAPEATLHLATSLVTTLRGRGEAEVTGFAQEKRETISGDTWTRTFSVLPGESSVQFVFILSPEDYGLFTDIAVQVTDKEGVSLVQDGLTNRTASIEFEPPKGAEPSAKYTLKVLAAAADPDANPRWALTVTETHLYSEPVKAKVTQGKSSGITLYPDRESDLAVTLESLPPALPPGTAWVLEGEIKDARNETLRLPFRVRLAAEDL